MENVQAKELRIKELVPRVYRFVRPFLWLFIGVLALHAIFALFTSLSMSMIKPITELIFEDSNSVSTSINKVTGSSYEKFYDFLDTIYLVKDDFGRSLINLSLIIIAIFLLKHIFKYWSSVVSVKFQEGIIKFIRDQVFSKLAYLPMQFFNRRKEGSILSVITNDVNILNQYTVNSISVLLTEITQIAFFLFMLISISPYLTLISFSTSISSLIILRFAIRYLRRYASRMQNAMADYTSTLHETISGIRIVKSYGAENSLIRKFSDQTQKYVKSAIKHQKIITIVPSANELFAVFALCVVLYVGGMQVVVSKEMAASDLMQFLFVLFSIMSPVSTTINNISRFQRGFVSAERVFDILDQVPVIISGNRNVLGVNNKLEFKNIHFAYDDAWVLNDVSFSIEKGKKIALVGASGSGKSTILDLLTRFYDPQKGAIELDGTNIKELDLHQYRSLFGVVSQETILFNDTVAYNIKFGKDSALDDELVHATEISNSAGFINDLPHGLSTIIGDRGTKLSGGQRQRLAIARSLIREPEILIFDEATSALDSESEKIVQNAINQSLVNKTAIIVAHRLATIIDCDKIYVFDRGQIVESGSHAQLLALNGVYKNLYTIQFEGGRD